MLYLISYDLIGRPTAEDYTPLINKLQSLGAREILRSQWILRANNSSAAIRDLLRPFTHSDDRLFVNEIGGNWAGVNLLVNISQM